MKIYIISHGSYEYERISLCTIDFEFAIKHYLDYYHKDEFWNSLGNIEVWESDKCVFTYGHMERDIVNCKKGLTYEEIKNDFIKRYEEEVGGELK